MMLAAFAPAALTPLGFQQAELAMKQALASSLGQAPRDETLALALAKTALETGRWQKIWNGNFGNIKCGQLFSGMYTCITLNEVLQGKVVWFAPEGQLAAGPGSALTGLRWPMPPEPEPAEGYGHPQTRMRAYANEFDGAYDYVDFVSKGRYQNAWARLLTGVPEAFVHELKMAGYFTADETVYARGVRALFDEMLKRVTGAPAVDVHLPDHVYEAAALDLWIDREFAQLDTLLADDKKTALKGEA